MSGDDRIDRITKQIQEMRYIIICQVILVLIATFTTVAILLVIGGPAVVEVLGLLFYIYLVIAIFGILIVFTWRCLED